MYQLWLLRWNVEQACRDLAYSKVYIENVKDFSKFTLFALITRAMESANARFGYSELTAILESQWGDWSPHQATWRSFCKASVDHILVFYKKEARAYQRSERKDLTFANYFKNEKFVGKIMNAPIPQKLRQLARNATRQK